MLTEIVVVLQHVHAMVDTKINDTIAQVCSRTRIKETRNNVVKTVKFNFVLA